MFLIFGWHRALVKCRACDDTIDWLIDDLFCMFILGRRLSWGTSLHKYRNWCISITYYFAYVALACHVPRSLAFTFLLCCWILYILCRSFYLRRRCMMVMASSYRVKKVMIGFIIQKYHGHFGSVLVCLSAAWVVTRLHTSTYVRESRLMSRDSLNGVHSVVDWLTDRQNQQSTSAL